jgi:small neutral amino acid transporter SnatA (MarC family)
VPLIMPVELLRSLLHFTVASLSIAGGVIMLVPAVRMLGAKGNGRHSRRLAF